jgi:hypothetical protein
MRLLIRSFDQPNAQLIGSVQVSSEHSREAPLEAYYRWSRAQSRVGASDCYEEQKVLTSANEQLCLPQPGDFLDFSTVRSAMMDRRTR